MRQCSLERKQANGTQMQVSWIPEEFAKAGKFLRLLEGEVWENGWKVTFVGDRKVSTEVHERSQDYKRQRDSSDI